MSPSRRARHQPIEIGTGCVLLEDCGAAGRAQFIALGIGALFLGRDPCIPIRRPAATVFWRFGGMARGQDLVKAACLQFNKVFVNGRLERWPGVGQLQAGSQAGR